MKRVLWLSLMFLAYGESGVAQTRVITADHSLMAGQTRQIDFGWLDAGRPYFLGVEFVSETSSSEDSWVEVIVETDSGPMRRLLNHLDYIAYFEITPRDSGGGILRITGGGELAAAYRIRTHWRPLPAPIMPGVTYIPAPHQNVRPSGTLITAVVVHATVSPTLESTVRWFLAPESQVSAHYTVGKDGKIVQMVEDSVRAWHAGVSDLEGVRGVNDYSIGIEIVNLNDGRDPYTSEQYEAVANIIRHVRVEHAIPESRIVSHEFIARPPGRKSDPRGFDFQRLFRMLRNRAVGGPGDAGAPRVREVRP